MQVFAILVTGSRDLKDHTPVWEALEGFRRADLNRIILVMDGDCPTGADLYARQWVKSAKRAMFKVMGSSFPADWDSFSNSAGPIRNQYMVSFTPDVCLAFYQNGAANRGTASCVEKVEDAYIPVIKSWSN